MILLKIQNFLELIVTTVNRKRITKSRPELISKITETSQVKNSVRDQVERAYEKAKTNFADASAHFGDLREIGYDIAGSLKASGSAALIGAKKFDHQLLTYAKNSWNGTTDTAKAIVEAKKLSQVADIHASYITTNIENTAIHWKTLADITAQSALGIFTPWADRMGQLAAYTDKARAT